MTHFFFKLFIYSPLPFQSPPPPFSSIESPQNFCGDMKRFICIFWMQILTPLFCFMFQNEGSKQNSCRRKPIGFRYMKSGDGNVPPAFHLLQIRARGKRKIFEGEKVWPRFYTAAHKRRKKEEGRFKWREDVMARRFPRHTRQRRRWVEKRIFWGRKKDLSFSRAPLLSSPQASRRRRKKEKKERGEQKAPLAEFRSADPHCTLAFGKCQVLDEAKARKKLNTHQERWGVRALLCVHSYVCVFFLPSGPRPMFLHRSGRTKKNHILVP